MHPRTKAKHDEDSVEVSELVPKALAFEVALPAFEGPLDLLLHLIKEHRLDILDIPIALVTQKYLEYLARMEALDIDVAAEFLVMAATLAHIKSRMLLPREDVVAQETPEEDGEDPRAALVKRLLEYQKYREAGEALGRRHLLGRDVFLRAVPADEHSADELGYAEVSVFKLIESLDKTLKSASLRVDHEVHRDRLSLADSVNRVSDRLAGGKRLTFAELVADVDASGTPLPVDRHRLVLTFLALLEMAKLRLLRILQADASDELVVALREEAAATPTETNAQDDYRN